MDNPVVSLRIDVEHQRDAYVIRARGELSRSSRRDLTLALALALDRAEQAATDRIVLDLEGLTSIDSAGLETLMASARRSANNGNRLQLTRGQGYTAEMFRLTGLDMTLPLIDPALCPAIRASGCTA